MDSIQAIEQQVESDECKATNIPYWAMIKNGIVFRGTFHELKA